VMSAAFDLEHVSAVLPCAVVPRADVIDVIVQEAVVMRALDHPHAVPAVRVLEMAVLDDAVARVREFREMLDSRVRPGSLTVDVHAVDDDVGAAGEIDRGCEPVLLPRG